MRTLQEIMAQDLARKADRREHPRTPVSLRGRVYCGSKDVDCTVIDMSPAGAQIKAAGIFEVASVVTLKIANFGAVHARVIWQREDRLGLQFLEDARRIALRFERVL